MNKEAKDWLERVGHSLKPKIEGSEVFASLVTSNYLKSPECALQIGYAVLLGKPIILLVDKDLQIPPSLVRIASQIERVDFDDEASKARAFKAVGEFAQGFR